MGNDEIRVGKHCCGCWQSNCLKPPAKTITIIILKVTIYCLNSSFQPQIIFFLRKAIVNCNKAEKIYRVTNILQNACDLVRND